MKRLRQPHRNLFIREIALDVVCGRKSFMFCYNELHISNVPVAQLDRALASEAKGRWFNSSQARQLY